MSKKVVITGAAGFIGFNLIQRLRQHGFIIFVLDKFGYASQPIEEVRKHCFKVYTVDLSKEGSAFSAFDAVDFFGKPDVVLHLASESMVDSSIESPAFTLRNNIDSAINVLEYCRKNDIKCQLMSTDEVYGSITEGQAYSGNALRPSSAYSASKAAVDDIAESYRTTYKMDITTIRMTNVYGGYQHPEKMIPKTIQALLKGDAVKVFGDGSQRRNWLHIEDACTYYQDLLTKTLKFPYDIAHFTGNNEINNLNLVLLIAKLMEVNPKVEFIEDRKGHDQRYALARTPANNAKDNLHQPSISLEMGLKATIEHYRERFNDSAS